MMLLKTVLVVVFNGLCNGKTPGADAIPSEIYKAGGSRLIEKITEFLCEMCSQKHIPQEFKDASIIQLYK